MPRDPGTGVRYTPQKRPKSKPLRIVGPLDAPDPRKPARPKYTPHPSPDTRDRADAARTRNVGRGAAPSGGPGRQARAAAVRMFDDARRGKASVADLQRHLRAAGFDVRVDGVWGPQTEAAAQKYAGTLERSVRGNARAQAREYARAVRSTPQPERMKAAFGDLAFAADKSAREDQLRVRQQTILALAARDFVREQDKDSIPWWKRPAASAFGLLSEGLGSAGRAIMPSKMPTFDGFSALLNGQPLPGATTPIVRRPDTAIGAALTSQLATGIGTAFDRTITDVYQMAVGAPGGILIAASDPAGAARAIAQDYQYRYGPLFQGDFAEAIKRNAEHPVFFALDVAAVLQGGFKAAQVGRLMAKTPKVRELRYREGRVQPWRSPSTSTAKVQEWFDRFSERNPEMPLVGARSRTARRLEFEQERRYETARSAAVPFEQAAKKLKGPERVAYDLMARYGNKAVDFLDMEINGRVARQDWRRITKREVILQRAQITALKEARSSLLNPSDRLMRAVGAGRELTEQAEGALIKMRMLTPETARNRVNLSAQIWGELPEIGEVESRLRFYAQARMSLPDVQADAALAAADEMARHWSRATGKPATEWWEAAISANKARLGFDPNTIQPTDLPGDIGLLYQEGMPPGLPHMDLPERLDFEGIAKTMLDSDFPLPDEIANFEGLKLVLENVWDLARAGAPYRDWYQRAAQSIRTVAEWEEFAPKTVAQVTAIYSQSANPTANMAFVIKALREFKENGEVVSLGAGGRKQRDKVNAILNGEEWQGRKTNSFYANIIEDVDPEDYRALFGDEYHPVTVDRWVVRMLAPQLKTDVPGKFYDGMEQALSLIAEQLGWRPKEVQAASWVTVKSRSLLDRYPKWTQWRAVREAADAYEAGIAKHGSQAALFQGLSPRQQAWYDSVMAGLEQKAGITGPRQQAPIGGRTLALQSEAERAQFLTSARQMADDAATPDGGFTVDRNGTPHQNGGWAVALQGFEKIVKAEDVTPEMIARYRDEVLRVLDTNDDLRIGGWHDPETGDFYFDVSRVFPDQVEAHGYAQAWNQKAVFNFHTFESEETGSILGQGLDEFYERAAAELEHYAALARDVARTLPEEEWPAWVRNQIRIQAVGREEPIKWPEAQPEELMTPIWEEAIRKGFDPSDPHIKEGGHLLFRAATYGDYLPAGIRHAYDDALGTGDYDKALSILREDPDTPPEAIEAMVNLIAHGEGPGDFIPTDWFGQRRQRGAEGIRGAVEFQSDPGKAAFYFGEKADLSTFLHEPAHALRRSLPESDQQILRVALDMKPDEPWTPAREEQFARLVEGYFWRGEAPNARVREVMTTVREKLREIYPTSPAMGLPKEMRALGYEYLDQVFNPGFAIEAGDGAFYIPDVASWKGKAFGGRKRSLTGRNRKEVYATRGILQQQGRIRRGPEQTVNHFYRTVRQQQHRMSLRDAEKYTVPLDPDRYPMTGGLPPGHRYFNPDGYKLSRAVRETPSMDDLVSMFPEELVRQMDMSYDEVMALTFPKHVEGLPPEMLDMVRAIPDSIASAFTGRSVHAPGADFPAIRLLRDALDVTNGVMKAALIYGKLSYIPVNFAGNLLFLGIAAGPFAGPALARASQFLGRLPAEVLAKIDFAVGEGSLAALSMEGTTALNRGVRQLAHFQSKIADRLPRRAAYLYFAAKEGFKSADDLTKLLDQSNEVWKDGVTYHQIHNQIAETAEKAMVQFRGMSPFQREVISRTIFIYGWMRGAAKYTGRMPLDRPVRANLLAHLGQQEYEEVEKSLGKLVSYLDGLHPWGGVEEKLGVDTRKVSQLRAVNPVSTGGEALMALWNMAKGDPKAAGPQIADYLAPAVRMPVEFVTGYNTFFGESYDSRWEALYGQFPRLPLITIGKQLIAPEVTPVTIGEMPTNRQPNFIIEGETEARIDAIANLIIGSARPRTLNVEAAQARGREERGEAKSNEDVVEEFQREAKRLKINLPPQAVEEAAIKAEYDRRTETGMASKDRLAIVVDLYEKKTNANMDGLRAAMKTMTEDQADAYLRSLRSNLWPYYNMVQRQMEAAEGAK